MKKDFRLLLLFLLGLCALAACEKNGPECYQPTSVVTVNGFVARQVLHIDSTTDSSIIDTTIIQYTDTAFKAPAMYSIGMQKNIVLYGQEGATSIGVPFDPASKLMRYVFKYDTAVAEADTVTYYYSASHHFISNECGFTNYYYIDSVRATNNFIDSCALVKPDVTGTGSDVQVLFYFF